MPNSEIARVVKVALHCETTRSEAVMSRHIILVPMS